MKKIPYILLESVRLCTFDRREKTVDRGLPNHAEGSYLIAVNFVPDQPNVDIAYDGTANLGDQLIGTSARMITPTLLLVRLRSPPAESICVKSILAPETGL